MGDEITKDAGRLLVLLYKSYKDRCKNGMDMEVSACFDGADEVQAQFLPKRSGPDVLSLLWELERHDFIETQCADNAITETILTTKAISYMENQLKNGLKEIAEFIGNLIP